ncbi:MAG: Gfo/Idh/MocA family oxidoreductase [Chlamydiota bacterium]|nr:Gfo/Idh/MocA family oxidoreductase [Chlamydiota bacterium]
MNTYRKSVGLIGVGQWGKNLARIYFDLGALHTICDSDESALDRYQESFRNVHMTSNFQRVIDSDEIDKVVIAAPAAKHGDLAGKALKAGKDVFVEKPLCLDALEGEKLVKLAQENSCILMVGHLYHYHPAMNALEKIVAEGILGEIKYIAAHRLKLGTFRREENVLWSFSPHDISIILSLAGKTTPKKVQCSGTSFVTENVHDIVTASMQFENGINAHIYASWIHPFKEQKTVVIGTKGMAVLDDTKPLEEKLQITLGMIDFLPGNIPIAKNSESQFITLPQVEPLREECIHFLTCCNTRKPAKSDGEEGLRVLRVLQECQSQLMPLEKSEKYFAHETAIIENDAMIGENTKIWHFSNIKSNAKIGSNCSFGQNVVVFPGVVIGDNCKVQNNVSIFSGVICEDNVFLGPSMVFTNVLNPRSEVCRRGDYQTTLLRKGVSVGANATIVCGVELGAYSFVGAGAVVTKDTKPYSLMVGNPARHVGWMSRYGERLDLPLYTEQSIEVTCPGNGDVYVLDGDQLTAKSAVCEESVLA